MQELNDWVERISEDNKKGLRVIQKVLEVDGKKKFKKDPESNKNGKELLIKDVFNIPFEQAQKQFRKMTNVTNYSTNFGVRSKEADDYEILRYKKFSSVKIATILKHEVAATIDRWLQINDDEMYAKRIYFTVRDIFTFLKNKEPPKTLVKDGYRGEQVVGKPPRFD